jgi:dihydrofolate synthase/folylpolyglutamate synthase
MAAATRGLAPEMVENAALAKAWLPGRMQSVPALPPTNSPFSAAPPCSLGWPPLLLDGAHNSHGLAALGLSLAQAGIAPPAVIFACLADKNPAEMAPHLRALATGPIFVPPIADNPRAMLPQDLAAIIGLNAVPVSSLPEALALASGLMAERNPEAFRASPAASPLLICGSLSLLADFYSLRPDCLERPSNADVFPLP